MIPLLLSLIYSVSFFATTMFRTSIRDGMKFYLKTMVKRSMDHKLRLRDFDARNERIETMAVVKSRKESRGVLKEDIRCGGTRFCNSVVTILRM